MVLDRLRRLAQRHPILQRWLGEQTETQLTAYGVSFAFHLAMLLLFGSIATAVHSEGRTRAFESAVVDTALPELDRLDTTVSAVTDAPTTLEPVAAASSPNVSPLIVSTPPAAGVARPELKGEGLALAAPMVRPTTRILGQRVAVKGDGAEHVGGVEGAVDRLAVEILRQLEKGPTLVVWAFDASGSLQAERRRLAQHIRQVYAHVLATGHARDAEPDGLRTIVVAFGQDRRALTPAPTADPEAIAAAIAAVPLDETGVESTFQTVGEVVRHWGKPPRDGRSPATNTMVIVVTDEVGDDEGRLEEAVALATAAKVPVYVLGSPALFGRVEGYMDYTDPKTGKVYRGLPVRQGPESALIEVIRLPFWYAGPQYDLLDAGFGPYALSRLAGATGGIYFVTRMNNSLPSFDPTAMREYKPDWVSRAQYEVAVAKNPLRQAVLTAAQITQQNLPGQPALDFPPADDPDFKEAMARNQEIVARTLYTVDEALVPITQVAKLRDRETSRRWQAHYDLIRGRLVAVKIRCYEYNATCAAMKKDPRKFTKPTSNAWRLIPVDEVQLGEKVAAAAEEAKTLLRRVVADHKGTPWALLAQRELKDPFGFRWVETRVPPRPRRDEAAAARKKAAAKAEAPKPPPPKL
ncbi:MAG TPA: VWA domain-containing protein [Isosphaeraceae bacterium]